MGAEQFAWPEGTLLMWTGTASPTTALLVTNTRGTFARGWSNTGPSIGGTYTDHLTGQRADVSVGQAYSYNTELIKLEASATAVHMELKQLGINGSAGYKLYSGRITNMAVDGAAGGLYTMTFQYYANAWSAY